MNGQNPPSPLALWGGIECTVNRVGDEYFDQLEYSGHARRIEDLDLIAGLGIRTLRYPVLWERTAPQAEGEFDWSWPDERLHRLRELGIRPIVGLTHHGSGPRYTSLADPQFPEKLAHYARAVAERYPWVDAYTPVNEPLTTARFSGLYGHWYPHGVDDLSFLRVLLNECRAVALAMRAIREVNPAAQLVQTEDMGCTFSTSALAYQADFENERRWLSFDLLMGRVNHRHPLASYLCWAGLGEKELQPLLDAPCPPDIFGLNYYVTSERFLDERLELYPPHEHGGNGRHEYADVSAVGVLPEGIAGLGALLNDAWRRYRRPLAVTEAHMGCAPDEQIRWLAEVWEDARAARCDGVDVRAVTAWSLLGAYDWDSLLTRRAGHYEAGVFAVHNNRPQPTPLTEFVQLLAREGKSWHPALSTPGWWRRPARLLHPHGTMNESCSRELCSV